MRKRISVEADGRWNVTVTGAEPRGIGDPEVQATLVLVIWLALGLLVFVLMQVLARGRARALRMVEEKTGQLRHQALHDALTGLPEPRADHGPHRADARSTPARTAPRSSAMFIDLDGFKGVNDTFGHPVGDELLRVVAARITNVLRETDTIGRLGGDEFVVLVEGGAEKIAKRIVGVLREPFDLGTGSPITITTSIGIATGDREAAKDLLRDADIALYEAKGAGRNRYAEFRHEMHIAAHDRLELESDLRGAIARHELFLVYQPILDLETGEMPAAEALLRWQHPTRGLIPPDRVHRAGRGERRDRRHRRVGARDRLRAGRPVDRRRPPDPHLGQRLRAPARRPEPARAPSATRCTAPASIPTSSSLEITETALMRDAEAAAAILRELKASGVHIAIDDFGTGYSSLAYLQQLPGRRAEDRPHVHRRLARTRRTTR